MSAIVFQTRGEPFAGSVADYLCSLLPNEGKPDDPRYIVYFAGGEEGPVKIGSTVDPENRMMHLQCGSPVKLRLLAAIPGGPALERAFHKALAHHRLHGEWFERGEIIKSEIRHWRAKKRRLSCVAP